MKRRDIAVRTIAGALVSLAAAWAWARLLGPIPIATRVLPSVVIVAIACGFGTAGGRRVARGAGVLFGLGATFACGFVLGAMTLEDSTGHVAPGAFIKGVAEGLGILLTSTVPAPANAETVTAAIIFSGYVTSIACVLACTRAPATALIPAFMLFVGATTLSQGSTESPMLSGAIFAAASLALLALIPKSGKRGGITDGVAFAEAERDVSPGRYIYGATISVFIVAISFLAFAVTNATGVGKKPDPFDPHRSANYRPRTDVNPVMQVQSWQTISRSAQTPLFNTVGTNLTTAYWWATAESYNGQDWLSRKTFDLTDGTVPFRGPTKSYTRPVTGKVTTTPQLEGPWIPNVHCAYSFVGPPIRSNSECDLITRSETAANISYSFASLTLSPTSKDQLTSALRADPGLATTANELPSNFPALLAEFADTAMPDDETPWNQLQGLNNSLSTDEYQLSTSNDYNPFGYEAINRFVIESKSGTQAQYATAFALMARYKGFSTRLATGFKLPAPRGGAVTSRQAIVWPEVKLTQVGWVPFAPGPLGAKAGVPVPQFNTPKPAPKPQPPPPAPAPQPEPSPPAEPEQSGLSSIAIGALVAAAVAAAWIGFVAVWRRRVRRRLGAKNRDRSFGPWTWMRAVRRHVHAGLPMSPGATQRGEPLLSEEVRKRRRRKRKDDSSVEPAPQAANTPGPGLVELAAIAEPALYGPDEIPADANARAWDLSDADAASVVRASGFRGRARWWLIPIRVRGRDGKVTDTDAPKTMGEMSKR